MFGSGKLENLTIGNLEIWRFEKWKQTFRIQKMEIWKIGIMQSRNFILKDFSPNYGKKLSVCLVILVSRYNYGGVWGGRLFQNG